MSDKDDDYGGVLGPKFWFVVIGIAILGAIGAGLVFALVGRVWYSWGLLGVIIVVPVIALAVGYLIDRRDARRARSWE